MLNLLGLLKLETRNYQQGAYYYEQALCHMPENADSLYNLGLCYTHLNQYEQAIEHYKQALRLEPFHASAHYMRGKARFNIHQHDAAIFHLQQSYSPYRFINRNRSQLSGQRRLGQ